MIGGDDGRTRKMAYVFQADNRRRLINLFGNLIDNRRGDDAFQFVTDFALGVVIGKNEPVSFRIRNDMIAGHDFVIELSFAESVYDIVFNFLSEHKLEIKDPLEGHRFFS